MQSTERFSRALTKVLRHSALNDGIPIREDGFVCLSDLVRNDEDGGRRLYIIIDSELRLC